MNKYLWMTSLACVLFAACGRGTNLASVKLGKLAEIKGHLELASNGGEADLTSFDFGALTRIRGRLNIRDNANVKNLDGFSALTTVDDRLVLRDNALLESGLASLRKLSAMSTSTTMTR